MSRSPYAGCVSRAAALQSSYARELEARAGRELGDHAAGAKLARQQRDEDLRLRKALAALRRPQRRPSVNACLAASAAALRRAQRHGVEVFRPLGLTSARSHDIDVTRESRAALAPNRGGTAMPTTTKSAAAAAPARKRKPSTKATAASPATKTPPPERPVTETDATAGQGGAPERSAVEKLADAEVANRAAEKDAAAKRKRGSGAGAASKPAGNGGAPRMTGPRLAVKVLEDAGHPLHVKLLCQRVIAAHDALPPAERFFKGKTPDQTLAAQLAVSAKKDDGIFVRTEPGTFGLRSWPKATLAKRAERAPKA